MKKNIKLGTHNSMSYLSPKKWYLYPFRFVAKCQKLDIIEQHKLGARMFDIRISFDKEGNPEFRHGSMAFKGDVDAHLCWLNSKRNIYVRLLLEVNNTKDLARQEALFLEYCKYLEKSYKNIKFFCGRRKFDWKVVYEFKTPEPDIVQKVSSMTGTVLDDWCPWLYAKFMNKKNITNHKGTNWLLIDFIGMS